MEINVRCPAGQVIRGIKARDSDVRVGSIDGVYCKNFFDIDNDALGEELPVSKLGTQWGQQSTSLCPSGYAIVGMDSLYGDAAQHGNAGKIDNIKFRCATRQKDAHPQSYSETWTRLFGLQPNINVSYRNNLTKGNFVCDYYGGMYATGLTINQQHDLDAIKMYCSNFKKQNDLLIGNVERRTYCCNNYDPTFCGPYKAGSSECDSHMKWYCSGPGLKSKECACMNSEIPRPMCFDKRCTTGYQTADMRARSCEGAYFDCKQYLTLSPESKNNVLNNVQLEQTCSAKQTEVIPQPPNGGPQTNPNDQSEIGGISTGGDWEKPITLPPEPQIPIIDLSGKTASGTPKWQIYLLLLLIAVVIGGAIYYYFFSKDDGDIIPL